MKPARGRHVIADHRKARYHYHLGDDFEAGIALLGSEVKSLRSGQANIAESYALIEEGRLFLVNAYIPTLPAANRENHDPRRKRGLLLHRREIKRLIGQVERKSMTLIPLSLYFNPRGLVKVKMALGRGKKLYDKRQSEKTRDWQRQKQRLMKQRG